LHRVRFVMLQTSDLRRGAMVAIALVLACASGAAAQEADSRTAAVAAEQTAKAGTLVPYEPGRAERFLIETRRRLLESPSGVYPVFGSVYGGGGFTVGAGYRHFYGDRTRWNVAGLYSLKAYKLLELSTTSLGHARGKVDLQASVGWRDATQVAYHGLGIDSTPDRTNYRMKQLYAGGNLGVRPVPWVVLTAGLTVEDFTLEQGQGTHPSIDEVYTPATAPGLGVNPTYLHAIASAGIDTRPSPGYARRGGLYEVSYHNYADRDSTYSFDRVDAEIVQHIPVLRENWVISLHGLLRSTIDDDDAVPYFLMPSLGSGSTLRGYSSWRFRDRQSLLMSAEWRWIPNRLGLDMALFYDAGIVTQQFRQLTLNGMKSDVGIGIRFHSPVATPLRIDLARGREGFNLVFSGGAAF
jgi:outer membrane protein assembly factor BamA